MFSYLLPTANAWAPGHTLLLMRTHAWLVPTEVDSRTDHAGWPSNSVKKKKKRKKKKKKKKTRIVSKITLISFLIA